MGRIAHHPLFQQFSLGVQQQAGSNWLICCGWDARLRDTGRLSVICSGSTDSNLALIQLPWR